MARVRKGRMREKERGRRGEGGEGEKGRRGERESPPTLKLRWTEGGDW